MGVNMLNCKISDIAYYLPESVVDNKQLSARYKGWAENKIYEKTGILTRHVISKEEHVSDLAIRAALKLFSQGKVKPEEIELLILCTQTPDYNLPATACFIQEHLGIPKSCAAFDFNQGCTGFIYGLAIAGSMLNSGLAKNALFITAESYTRWCHPMDKSVVAIFGDAAAAVYLRRLDNNEAGMGTFVFGTDGSGFKNLIVPSSGSHIVADKEEASKEISDKSGNIRTISNLYMNGPELFRFAMTIVPPLVENIIRDAGIAINDVDKFVFHQANAYMLRNLQEKMNLPEQKMIYALEDTGNTVSSSIPIALKKSCDKGEISKGDKLMLVGFGVGYSWAGNLLNWDPD